MLNVVTVYSTVHHQFLGENRYNEEYVWKLKRGFERHMHVPYKFIVLTDNKVLLENKEINTIPLKDGLPGWWAKMELFKPKQFSDTVLYCDLDTVILKDITKLATVETKADLIMMRDHQYPHLYNGCLMKWTIDLSFLYKIFTSDTGKYMQQFSGLPYLADQGFIQSYSKKLGYPAITFWQDLFPKEYFINYPGQVGGDNWKESSLAWWTWKPKPHLLREHPMVAENWI